MRLEVYATLLTRWNAKINLVSRGDEGRVWSRHIADALQLVALMPDGLLLSVGLASQHAGEAPDDAKKTAWAIDLGSGGGFRVWFWRSQLLCPFTY